MKKEKAEQIVEEARKRERRLEHIKEARENLLSFITLINERYLVNWHHDAVCYELERYLYEEDLRLTIWIPPRYGKSEIVSKMFPAWLLGIEPSLKIVISSYSADLAEDFNTQVQEIIKSEDYNKVFPDTKLKRATRSITKTTKGGYLYAVGVDGTLTGKGADILICVHGDTIVNTNRGLLKIKDCQEGYLVESWNEKENISEFKNINKVFENGLSERYMVEIETETGKKIQVTNDHPIYIKGKGYIRADQIRENDEVLVC